MRPRQASRGLAGVTGWLGCFCSAFALLLSARMQCVTCSFYDRYKRSKFLASSFASTVEPSRKASSFLLGAARVSKPERLYCLNVGQRAPPAHGRAGARPRHGTAPTGATAGVFGDCERPRPPHPWGGRLGDSSPCSRRSRWQPWRPQQPARRGAAGGRRRPMARPAEHQPHAAWRHAPPAPPLHL